jgi:hypothetical protein
MDVPTKAPYAKQPVGVRYFKISVDDTRDRVIVRCTGNTSGKMIAGRRVGKDGLNIKNELILFSPEDIKYEMVMNKKYCELERLQV